jgi:DNA polymerase III subunit chi
MRVDFYQLGSMPLHQAAGSLARKVLESGGRLLLVMADEGALARLDRLLWDLQETEFLPHGVAGGAEDARQPVLLSTTPDPVNGARNILLADGEWREAALAYDRAFHLFDGSRLEEARLAWKLLSGREGVERFYHEWEEGRWVRRR